MKNTYLLLLAVVIFSSCSEEKKKKEVVSKPNAEILMKESMQRFSSAWNQGDAIKISDEFTQDAIRIVSNPSSPIKGQEAIQQIFKETFSDESEFKNSHIEVEVIETRSVSDEIYLGAGKFKILNEQNEIIEQGKWGNVFKYNDGKIKFLMESAHRTPKESTASESVSKIKNSMSSDEPHFEKIKESVSDYISTNNSQNAEGLSSLFISNGIQNVNSKEGIILGQQNIKATESYSDGEVLDANVLGYRYLGNNIAIAYGEWSATSKDNLTVNGQWGNLFKIEEETALLIMESAGVYQK